MVAVSVYEQVIEIIQDYLGPAGKRFIDRQVEFHLKKSSDDITKEDVIELTEWIKVSLALLTDDEKTVDDCVERLQKIS